MSDSPILQIDDDWKRQAQEEKRKLAEREASARKPAPPPAPAAAPAQTAAVPALPDASFSTLVRSLMTQALYYMGELADEGEQPLFSLDAAKNQIDLLGILDAKTKGNLDASEQSMLDQALYDLRSRYVSIASQYIR
jgi:hypothetical protein